MKRQADRGKPSSEPGAAGRFSGRVALVTGASSGIGRTIATRLAAAGAAVGLAGIDRAELQGVQREIAGAGGRAAVLHVDVRNRRRVEAMAGRAFDVLGPVDCLVNNAGIYPNTRLLDVPEAEWDAVLDTNLKGPFLCAQAVCRRMVEMSIAGRVVNISSTASTVGRPGTGPYSASKAGLNMLTRVLAIELAPHGILVNAVCPGLVATPRVMAMATPADHAKKVGPIPLQREGRMEEIADLVCFLLSPEASYCTGGLFVADGGYSCGLVAYGGVAAGDRSPAGNRAPRRRA